MYLAVTNENDHSTNGNNDSEDAEEQDGRQEHFMYHSQSTTERKYKQKNNLSSPSQVFPLLSNQHADFLMTASARIPTETNV